MDTPPPRAWSEFECAACGSHLTAPAEQIARLIGCPTCGAVSDSPEWAEDISLSGAGHHGVPAVVTARTGR